MHYAGLMAQRTSWRQFAARHGLLLIEDAAHAVGVAGVGSYGDGAAFSFYGNKNMTTAEGGMVLMRSPEALERVRQMRGHGMTSGAFQRLNAPHAALRRDDARLQLPTRRDKGGDRSGAAHPPRGNAGAARDPGRTLSRAARQAAAGSPCPGRRSGSRPTTSCRSCCPRAPIAIRVSAAMRDAGVQTTIHYPPVHRLTFYRDRYPGLSLPQTEAFYRRELTLPLHPRMEASDVDRVVEALDDALVATVGLMKPASGIPRAARLARVLDVVFALVALIALWPVITLISLAIVAGVRAADLLPPDPDRPGGTALPRCSSSGSSVRASETTARR